MYNVFFILLPLTINVSIFHITQLDTFWTIVFGAKYTYCVQPALSESNTGNANISNFPQKLEASFIDTSSHWDLYEVFPLPIKVHPTHLNIQLPKPPLSLGALSSSVPSCKLTVGLGADQALPCFEHTQARFCMSPTV